LWAWHTADDIAHAVPANGWMEGRLDRPTKARHDWVSRGRFRGGLEEHPDRPSLPIASIASNLSSRAWREGAYGQSNSSLPCSHVQQADLPGETSSPRRHSASARRADDSEQAGEATEPDCHHDPDQAPASPTSTRRPPFGRPPAARTRTTSILAFGSGSRPTGPLRRSLDLWSPISWSSASSPVRPKAPAKSRKPVPTSS